MFAKTLSRKCNFISFFGLNINKILHLEGKQKQKHISVVPHVPCRARLHYFSRTKKMKISYYKCRRKTRVSCYSTAKCHSSLKSFLTNDMLRLLVFGTNKDGNTNNIKINTEQFYQSQAIKSSSAYCWNHRKRNTSGDKITSHFSDLPIAFCISLSVSEPILLSTYGCLFLCSGLICESHKAIFGGPIPVRALVGNNFVMANCCLQQTIYMSYLR